MRPHVLAVMTALALAPAAAYPQITEGFDDIATLPGAGWFLVNRSQPLGATDWFQGGPPLFSSHSGAPTSYIGANYENTSGAGTISNWLLTPAVTLVDGATLQFYTRTVDDPAFPDRLQVRISTNGASTDVGVTAADVGDFTTLLLDINPTYTTTGYPDVWTQFTLTVTGVPAPTVGRLAFRYFVEDGGDLGANSDAIGIDTLVFNHPPVLDPIGDRTVAEGATLTFTISASDLDGDAITYSATSLPSGATFDPGTRTFSWTPSFVQAGSYPGVTFTAEDTRGGVDSEAITITVTNTNRPPVLGAIGNQTVAEGATLSFIISATDPDLDALTYSASSLPSGATFDPGTRTFSWTPSFTQAGSYPGVTFTVEDGLGGADSEAITITVTNANGPPVLAAIGNQTVAENATLTFTISATDPDSSDTLTYSASALPSGATFDPGTRTFSWTPSFTQAGSYPGVTFSVNDGQGGSDSEAITITVTNTNRPPVLAAIGNQTVAENATLTFTISATDPDSSDTLTYSASSLPSGATFDPGTRTFSWTPSFTQAGSYPDVTFSVNDGQGGADSEAITITVTNTNRPPVLAAIGNQTVAEGATLTFIISGTDPDADPLTYSASSLPSGATFDPGTRTFSWTPSFTQAGSYPGVTFTVEDGLGGADSEAITITVTETNRPPVLAAIGNQTVAEGATLTFIISGTDPDADPLTYSASSLPSGATFDPGTRTFSWTPSFTQAGSYPGVTFTVEDGLGGADSEAITITVTNTNRPPVLAAIGNQTVAEGATLTFIISATDPDADPLTYSASSLPSGATFDPGTRTFTWTPTFGQAGSYPGVTFTVEDALGGADSEAITITVTNTNRPPVLAAIGNQTVAEGATLTFTISASDPDADPLTYSASSLPSGATFDPGTRTFTWTPTFAQAGSYPGVTFTVEDAIGGADSEAITVTVTEALVSPRGDFNGDRKPDLVWRHDFSDQNVVWFMNGVNLVSGTFTNPPVLADNRWKIVGTNDFNRDGLMDFLWRHNSSGENVVWFMNGVDLVSGTFTTPTALADVRWQMVGTGDFNLDALPDILWRHDFSGENVLWYMNGTVLTTGTFLTPAALDDVRWKMAGVADFNLDGHQDILWHHNTSGQAVLWYMNGSVLVNGTFTSPNGLSDVRWRMVAVGDYNADGKPDIVWRHQSSGQNVVWFMDNATLISGTFTNPSTLEDTNWKLVGPR